MEILDKSLFEKATEEEKSSVEVQRESVTYWQDAYRRFKKNKVALVSIIIIGIITDYNITISFFGGFCQPISSDEKQNFKIG